MPFFSVIIPTYNRAALLREALESVARQTFRDFELFVVDDGSTDDTEAIVKSCGLPVIFVRQNNRGPGAARNLALQKAQGRYLAFLDSDDQWFGWTLDTYYRTITGNNYPAFMSGFARPLDDSLPPLPIAPGEIRTNAFPHLLAACVDRVPPVGGTPSICLDRVALEEAGGFVSRRISGEDTDLWLRLGLKPGFIRILSPPVFKQRKHAGNVTNQLDPSLAGCHYLLQQERRKAYPGGLTYQRQRRRIICGTARTLSRDCVQEDRPADGWSLYLITFPWNLALGNLKYLAGFPVVAARRFVRPRPKPIYEISRTNGDSR
jgi:GT2 family glycosyltransferase